MKDSRILLVVSQPKFSAQTFSIRNISGKKNCSRSIKTSSLVVLPVSSGAVVIEKVSMRAMLIRSYELWRLMANDLFC